MKKSRVQLWGKPGSYVVVDIDATDGAVLGQNLRWPDGRLVQASDFAGGEQGANHDGEVYWRSLQEIPANVEAVAELVGDGFVRKSGTAWSASPIVNADLSGANTTGLAEGQNLYFTEQRAADAAPIQAVQAGEGIRISTADPRRPVISSTVRDGQIRFTGQGPPPAVIAGAHPGDTYLDALTGDIYKLT